MVFSYIMNIWRGLHCFELLFFADHPCSCKTDIKTRMIRTRTPIIPLCFLLEASNRINMGVFSSLFLACAAFQTWNYTFVSSYRQNYILDLHRCYQLGCVNRAKTKRCVDCVVWNMSWLRVIKCDKKRQRNCDQQCKLLQCRNYWNTKKNDL